VAQVYGNTAVGIILTGMGQDGAEGLKAMHEAGAYTIAQNKETCAVFGMPAVAIELGAVEQIEPPAEIADTLIRLVQGL
jgi:two-component system chemotaxis response regulator CheB